MTAPGDLDPFHVSEVVVSGDDPVPSTPPVPPRVEQARSPGRRAASTPRSTLVGALRLLAGLLAVGVFVGLLWWAVAPTAKGLYAPSGFYPNDTEPDAFINSDVLFTGLTAVAGLVAAVLTRRRWRHSRAVAVVVLAGGGFLAALLASWVGARVGPSAHPGVPFGSYTDVPLRLTARGWLLVWPVVAVAYWFVADVVELASAGPVPEFGEAADRVEDNVEQGLTS